VAAGPRSPTACNRLWHKLAGFAFCQEMLEGGTALSPMFDEALFAKLVLANAREHAILFLDEGGRIESWLGGAETIFGYSAEEAIGRPVADLFLPSDVAAHDPEHELEAARNQGRAEDSRWHRRKNGERFWGNGVVMRVEAGGHLGFLKILRDETRMKLADEQRVLLLNELNHRIKNTLAIVQSIAEQTLRAAHVDPETRASLTDRLFALSQAHDVLVRENWAGADLEAVVAQAVAAHRRPGSDAFHIEGPPVRLSPQQAVSLSLALHELATNAVKYGALSNANGRVDIFWNTGRDGDGLRYMTLLWAENGGPPVRGPIQEGFGMRLIARTFNCEDGRCAKLDFQPEGLRCVLELPLSEPAERPIFDPSRTAAAI